ncbi:MAG TPA: type II toxin-antitoxin system RelE/ParE family toxin [Usitatibacter sp.]|nr:type II toxin-antitoxin system RelE/ParE family toxin [Usitatibacter sp.]
MLPPALEDLQRLAAFLRVEDPQAASDTARLIFEALRVLEKYPLIGRAISGERRELVIYRGRTGYLAQYQYDPTTDEVLVVAWLYNPA